jgi:hypothetical protein
VRSFKIKKPKKGVSFSIGSSSGKYKSQIGDICCLNPKGENMSLDDACKFVVKMREDRKFREKVLQTINSEDLVLFLRGENMLFDQRELAVAMAECMAQMEQR